METIETSLDVCLARWQAGENLDECLKDYPDQAAELAGLLAVAAELIVLPKVEERAEAVAEGRRKLIAAVAEQSHAAVPSWPVRIAARARATLHLAPGLWSKPALRFALGIVFAVVLLSQVAVGASANSLPGDALYPVKRSWEQLRLTLTFAPDDRLELADQFTVARRQEVANLVQQGREATTEIEGVLTTADDAWSIDGLSVRSLATTRIEGLLSSGIPVRAQVHTLKDGRVVVNWIKVMGGEARSDAKSGDRAPAQSAVPEDAAKTAPVVPGTATPAGRKAAGLAETPAAPLLNGPDEVESKPHASAWRTLIVPGHNGTTPGNQQPDKPNKPDTPDKPDKPDKPDLLPHWRRAIKPESDSKPAIPPPGQDSGRTKAPAAPAAPQGPKNK